MVALLAVQGLVFLLWAVLMFRGLFALRRRAVARSGRMIPGPGATLDGFAAFLRDPEFRRERNRLGLVTVLLFALVAANIALGVPQ